MKEITLQPLDTLFFRDGKPFGMGDSTWADGIFPPSPSVVYGGLRSSYFAQNNSLHLEREALDKQTEGFRINGIFILINGKKHFPVPLDIAYDKDDKSEKKPFQLALSESDGLNSQTKSGFTLTHQLQGEEGTAVVNFKPGGLLKQSDFEKYLAGVANFDLGNFNTKEMSSEKNELGGKGNSNIEEKPIRIVEDYWQPEPKVGIGRDKITKTAKEGMLYRVGMMRFNTEKYDKVQIRVNYEGLETLMPSQFRLGGEGKSVNCRKVENEEISKVNAPKELETGGIFKLYLATPSIFEQGTFPKWMLEKEELKLKKEIELEKGLTVELVSMAIGKPQHIGGFDMKEKRPKPMLKAVPAGSIYYFRLKEGSFSTVVERFHGKSIAELDFDKQGFGICYVGIQP